MGELGGDIQALATADDPSHAAHRKLLVPQLAGKRIRALEAFVAETEDHLWHEGLQGGGIEWMSAMANRLPMMIVTRLIETFGRPRTVAEEEIEEEVWTPSTSAGGYGSSQAEPDW